MSEIWGENERALCAQAGVDEEVGRWLSENIGPIERLRGYNDDSIAGYDAQGLCALVPRERLEEALDQARKYLQGRAYAVFWSPRPEDGLGREELCVIAEGDFYAPLLLRNTDGANYDLLLDDIIARLESWREGCEFEITGAGLDFVSLLFETLPEDVCAFAEDIYRFCPDVVEQGVGLISEEDDPELWALAQALPCRASDELRDEKRREGEQAQQEAPEIVREIMQSVADDPETGPLADLDRHLSLLAAELRRSHSLFLWWD
jgi:hypothetical protein